MKVVFFVSAAALFCSTVFAADRDPSKDENSSNNSKISLLDFEITENGPVQEGVLAFISNPWSLNFPSTIDSNVLTDYLPTELIIKIFYFTQQKYMQMAQICKHFYRLTRPIHYQCMKHIALEKGVLANRLLKGYFKDETDLTVPITITLHMTILAGEKFDVWMKSLLVFSNNDIRLICHVLRNVQKYSKLNPSLMSSLRESVVTDETLLKVLCLECANGDSVTFTLKDLKDLLDCHTEQSKHSIRLVLAELIYTAYAEVSKLLADSLDPSLWSLIKDIWETNESIDIIVDRYTGLSVHGDEAEEFSKILLRRLPGDLPFAYELMRCLNRKHVPCIYFINLSFFSILFSQDFCSRHQFNPIDCFMNLPKTEVGNFIKVIVDTVDLTTDWAQKVLADCKALLSPEQQQSSLEFLMVTGRPVSDFTGFKSLSADFIDNLTSGKHSLCKYMNTAQIEYVVQKFKELNGKDQQ